MNPIKKRIFELSLIHTHFNSMLELMETEIMREKVQEEQIELINAYRYQVRNYYKSCMSLKKELKKWFKYERDNDLPVEVEYRQMHKRLEGIREPNI